MTSVNGGSPIARSRRRSTVRRTPAGEEPRLEREARGEGRQRDHVLALDDQARALLELLAEDVAEEAALAVVVVRARVIQLLQHLPRHDGCREELRVRVPDTPERLPGVPLEEQGGTKARVTLEL